MFNLRLKIRRRGSWSERFTGRSRSDVEVTPESSPVPESFAGRRRGGAGFAIGGTKSSGRVIGANDTVRLAVAGLNGRGGAHVGRVRARCRASRSPTWSIPTPARIKKRLDQIAEREAAAVHRPPCRTSAACSRTSRSTRSRSPRPTTGTRLITIWACQAGKDVYVEKPCSHNVHEGRIAVEAARRYNRIVQHGTQSRSSRDWALAVAAIQSGKSASCWSRGPSATSRATASASSRSPTPPKQLDFDIWLGPAPQQPYHANLVHYNWHWFWDFGNGDIGNQGVHQMDIARWLIPAASSSGHGASATFPKTVISLGGRFGYHDQGQTANTQISVMDYGDTQLIFEVRGLKTERFPRARRSATSPISKRERIVGRASSIPRGRPEPVPLVEAGARSRSSAGRARATSATSSRPCAAARSRT